MGNYYLGYFFAFCGILLNHFWVIKDKLLAQALRIYSHHFEEHYRIKRGEGLIWLKLQSKWDLHFHNKQHKASAPLIKIVMALYHNEAAKNS